MSSGIGSSAARIARIANEIEGMGGGLRDLLADLPTFMRRVCSYLVVRAYCGLVGVSAVEALEKQRCIGLPADALRLRPNSGRPPPVPGGHLIRCWRGPKPAG
jgi:hypothetical protein